MNIFTRSNSDYVHTHAVPDLGQLYLRPAQLGCRNGGNIVKAATFATPAALSPQSDPPYPASA